VDLDGAHPGSSRVAQSVIRRWEKVYVLVYCHLFLIY
jgi:hypothetical protein